MKALLRWLLQLVFMAFLGFGVFLSLVYPWAVSKGSFEIGRWQVYDPAGGFQPVELMLPDDQEQIIIRAQLSTPGAIKDIGNLPVMTLAVASDGHREFVHYFALDGSAGRQASPQNSSRFYTLEAGVLPLARDKPYLFAFGPGDAEIDMTRVDLLLIGSKRKLDDAILQTGYGFMAAGFIGLLLTLRRWRENPDSQPPPKWGR